MRARIHRGAAEIGGNCVELEAEGKRLVLDLGRPLGAGFDGEVPLPAVPGLDGTGRSLVGVVISHSHLDHWGLLDQVDPGVPLYIGQAAARMLGQASFFSPAGLERSWAGHLADGQPLQLGPFRVTPYLVDHSAVDAYALAVEADGRRLFYSGDLRAHGTDPAIFQRLLDEAPRAVNALLLEGTRVGRAEGPGSAATEADVERQLVEIFNQTEGLVLVTYSAQNLERLRTLYWATLNSPPRVLLIDPYVQAMVEATGRDDQPRVGLPRTGLYVPQSQRIKIKQAGQFERVDAHRQHRFFPDGLAARSRELVLTFRPSMTRELERAGCLDGAHLVWSMWPGYLEEERMSAFRTFLDCHQIPLSVAHASGHATVVDLQRLAETLAPDRVVPIHTAAPERFPDLFARVEPHPDGQWWEV